MTTAIAIQDVRREVKILRALSGNHNLIQFYDTYEDHEKVYIVMELCEFFFPGYVKEESFWIIGYNTCKREMAGGSFAPTGVAKERADQYHGKVTAYVVVACAVAAVGGALFGYH